MSRTVRKCSFGYVRTATLRKHAYSNILRILPPKKKKKNFRVKNFGHFYMSAQNIDCGNSALARRF